MLTTEDDRTENEKRSHRTGIVGQDTFLSGWGECSKNGLSYAAWACKDDDIETVMKWVKSRDDMRRVREIDLKDFRPTAPGKSHFHIYVVKEGHPALG